MAKRVRVACQGVPGAFSHQAALEMFSDADMSFYATFDDVLAAVDGGEADQAVLPVENSAAGRVADMHRLLKTTDLFVTGEHFLRVRHCLLGTGRDLSAVKIVRSHPQALSQCSGFLKRSGLKTEAAGNTAVAARDLAESKRADTAAIASETAARLYGLNVLRSGIEDSDLNTTRFWALARTPAENVGAENAVTSFLFWVKNEPAVLYKCLGGFATNGIDLLRLESYVDPERFLMSAGFLVDVAAHGESADFKAAMRELGFFAQSVRLLGTYPADPYRAALKNKQQ